MQLNSSLERVQRFFGPDLPEKSLRMLIAGFGPRILDIEKPHIRSLADLEQFVNTRANHMVLTPPRHTVIIDSPQASVERLFRVFVALAGRVPVPLATSHGSGARLETPGAEGKMVRAAL